MKTEDWVYTVSHSLAWNVMPPMNGKKNARFSASLLNYRRLQASSGYNLGGGLWFINERKWSRYFDLRVFFLISRLQRVNILRDFRMNLAFPWYSFGEYSGINVKVVPRWRSKSLCCKFSNHCTINVKRKRETTFQHHVILLYFVVTEI